MSLIPLGFWAASGGAAFTSSFDLLETEILASSAASVTFSGLSAYAADYQHLQIRAVARSARTDTPDAFRMRVNGVTGNSYSWHALWGSGSSVASEGYGTQNNMYIGNAPGNTATSGMFSGHVIDILDPFETSKYTTFRTLTGGSGTGIYLNSGLYQATTAISSIEFYMANANVLTGSRFSLYGIRGS